MKNKDLPPPTIIVPEDGEKVIFYREALDWASTRDKTGGLSHRLGDDGNVPTGTLAFSINHPPFRSNYFMAGLASTALDQPSDGFYFFIQGLPDGKLGIMQNGINLGIKGEYEALDTLAVCIQPGVVMFYNLTKNKKAPFYRVITGPATPTALYANFKFNGGAETLRNISFIENGVVPSGFFTDLVTTIKMWWVDRFGV